LDDDKKEMNESTLEKKIDDLQMGTCKPHLQVIEDMKVIFR